MKRLKYLILPAILAFTVLFFMLSVTRINDVILADHADFLKHASSYEIRNASVTENAELIHITITRDADIINGLLKAVKDVTLRKGSEDPDPGISRIISFETDRGTFTFPFAGDDLTAMGRRYPVRRTDALWEAVRSVLSDPHAEIKLKHDVMNYNFLLPPAEKILKTDNGFLLYQNAEDPLPVLEVLRTADERTAVTILNEKKEAFLAGKERKVILDAGEPRDLENSGCVYGIHGIYEEDGTAVHLLGTAYDADQVMIAMVAVCRDEQLDDMINAVNMIISTVSVGPLWQ